LAAGQIAGLPRLFAAQPLNCSPVEASFAAGVDTPIPRDVRKTVAEGTSIKRPLRLHEMIRALRESEGGAVAIPKEGIITALGRLA
jgi:threonine synthase